MYIKIPPPFVFVVWMRSFRKQSRFRLSTSQNSCGWFCDNHVSLNAYMQLWPMSWMSSFNSKCFPAKLLAFWCKIFILESKNSNSFIKSAYGKIAPGFVSISPLFSRRYQLKTKRKERLNLVFKAHCLLLQLPLNTIWIQFGKESIVYFITRFQAIKFMFISSWLCKNFQ